MKAVILCGGMGTRLKEETEYKPKPLVEIGGKPILWHIMKHYEHYGVKEFILCLGYKGNMIKDYFLNMHESLNDFSLNLSNKKVEFFNNNLEDWKIIFVNTGINNMTGSRIAQIKKYIGDEDFFLTYGDGLSDVNLSDLYKFHKKLGRVLTLTGISPTSHLGLLEVDENCIAKSFKEKPSINGIANGGFFVCNQKIFNYLSEDPNCVFEINPLKTLAADRQIAVYYHKGFWKSMDTFKESEQLNKMWDENPPWKIWK